MSSYAVYFTDLHQGLYHRYSKNGGIDRLEDINKVITDIFNFAIKREIDTVLFGGDWNDTTKILNVIVHNFYMQHLENQLKRKSLKFFKIDGNHDYATKNLIGQAAQTSTNPLPVAFPSNFFDCSNMIRVDKSERFAIAGIPYYEYPEHYSAALDALIDRVKFVRKNHPKIKVTLMIHQTPEQCNIPHIKCDTNPDDPRYELFDIVLCGHIHLKRKINPKFIIGGNPLHRDINDMGDEKGFWVLDLANPVETVRFVSRKGRYPEFTTKEQEGRHFYVPSVVDNDISNYTEDQSEINTDFHHTLSPAALLTNFWNQLDGKDEKLLQLGLSLISH